MKDTKIGKKKTTKAYLLYRYQHAMLKYIIPTSPTPPETEMKKIKER